MINTFVERLRVGLGLSQPVGAWTNGFIYDAAGCLTNVTSQGGSLGCSMVSYTLGSDLSGSLQGAGGIGGLLARSIVQRQPGRRQRLSLLQHLGWHWGHTCVANCACWSSRLGNYLQSYRFTRLNIEPCALFGNVITFGE